jgi:hypothetical protein
VRVPAGAVVFDVIRRDLSCSRKDAKERND